MLEGVVCDQVYALFAFITLLLRQESGVALWKTQREKSVVSCFEQLRYHDFLT
jgi:hypothetical protein